MKQMKIVLAFMLLLPLTFYAQNLEGDWLMEVPQEDGTTFSAKLSLADGAYTVDLGNDGSIDIEGTYTVDGDKISIQDTKGEQACLGDNTQGVYSFTVDESTFSMNKVSDTCEGRGGPEGKMQFSRL